MFFSLNGKECASCCLEDHQLRFVGRTEGRFVLCPLIGFVNRLEPLIIADVLYERLHLPQPRLHRFQLSAGTVIGAVNILDFGLKVSISEKTILGEIADGTGSFLKVVDLRPMLIALAPGSSETKADA